MFQRRGWYQPLPSGAQHKEWLKAQARALRQTQIQNSQSKADSLHANLTVYSVLQNLDLDLHVPKQQSLLPLPLSLQLPHSNASLQHDQDQTTKRVVDALGSFSDFWDLYEREGLSRLVGIQLPGTRAPPLTKRIPLEKGNPLAMKHAVPSASASTSNSAQNHSDRTHGRSRRHGRPALLACAPPKQKNSPQSDEKEKDEAPALAAAQETLEQTDALPTLQLIRPDPSQFAVMDIEEPVGSLPHDAAEGNDVTLIPLSPSAQANQPALLCPLEPPSEQDLEECFGNIFDSSCVDQFVDLLQDFDFNPPASPRSLLPLSLIDPLPLPLPIPMPMPMPLNCPLSTPHTTPMSPLLPLDPIAPPTPADCPTSSPSPSPSSSTEPLPEPEPEPEPELEPEQPGPEPQLQPLLQSEPEPEPEPEPVPENKPQSQTQPERELEREIQAQPQSDASQTESKTQPELEIQQQSQSESKAQPEPEPQAQPELELQHKPEPEPVINDSAPNQAARNDAHVQPTGAQCTPHDAPSQPPARTDDDRLSQQQERDLAAPHDPPNIHDCSAEPAPDANCHSETNSCTPVPPAPERTETLTDSSLLPRPKRDSRASDCRSPPKDAPLDSVRLQPVAVTVGPPLSNNDMRRTGPPHTFLHLDLALSDNSSVSSRSSSPSSSSLFDSSSSDQEDDSDASVRLRSPAAALHRLGDKQTVPNGKTASCAHDSALQLQPAFNTSDCNTSLTVTTPSANLPLPLAEASSSTSQTAGLLAICTDVTRPTRMANFLAVSDLEAPPSPSPSNCGPQAAQDWSLGSLMKAMQRRNDDHVATGDQPPSEAQTSKPSDTDASKALPPSDKPSSSSYVTEQAKRVVQSACDRAPSPLLRDAKGVSSSSVTQSKPASPKGMPQGRKLMSEQNKASSTISSTLPAKSEHELQRYAGSPLHDAKNAAPKAKGAAVNDAPRLPALICTAATLAKSSSSATAKKPLGANLTPKTIKDNLASSAKKDQKSDTPTASPASSTSTTLRQQTKQNDAERAKKSAQSSATSAKSSPAAKPTPDLSAPSAAAQHTPKDASASKKTTSKHIVPSTIDDTIKQTLSSWPASSGPNQNNSSVPESSFAQLSVFRKTPNKTEDVPKETRKIEVKLKLPQKLFAEAAKASLPDTSSADKRKLSQSGAKEESSTASKKDKPDLSPGKKKIQPNTKEGSALNSKSDKMSPSDKRKSAKSKEVDTSASKTDKSTSESALTPSKAKAQDGKMNGTPSKHDMAKLSITTQQEANAPLSNSQSKPVTVEPPKASDRADKVDTARGREESTPAMSLAQTEYGAPAAKRQKLSLKERIEKLERLDLQIRLKDQKPQLQQGVDSTMQSRSSSTSSSKQMKPTDAVPKLDAAAKESAQLVTQGTKSLAATAALRDSEMRSRSPSSSASSPTSSRSSSSKRLRKESNGNAADGVTTRPALIVSFPIHAYDAVIRKRMQSIVSASSATVGDSSQQRKRPKEVRPAYLRQPSAGREPSDHSTTTSVDSSPDTSAPGSALQPELKPKMLSPEFYYCEARRLKHEADVSKKSSFQRSLGYLKAIVLYCRCVCAMEHYNTSTVDTCVNLCRDTLPLIVHVKRVISHQKRKLVSNSTHSASYGRTLAVLHVACLRLEAALCLQMYSQKQPEILRLRCALDEYQKQIRLAPSMAPPSPPVMGDCEYSNGPGAGAPMALSSVFDCTNDRNVRASHAAVANAGLFGAKAMPFGNTVTATSHREEELQRRLSTYFRRACYDEQTNATGFAQAQVGSSSFSSTGASSSSFGSTNVSASSGYYSTVSPSMGQAACGSSSNVVTVPVAIQTMLDKYLYWSNFLVEAHQFWEEAERICHDLRTVCRSSSKAEVELMIGASVFETLALQTPLANVLDYISRVVTKLENLPSRNDELKARAHSDAFEQHSAFRTHHRSHHHHHHHHHHHNPHGSYRDPNVHSSKSLRHAFE